MEIIGVRKSEGGARAIAYKNCFFYSKARKTQEYLPLLWWTNSTKQEYESIFGIAHSRCYTEYGLKRTGCAGCPFNGKMFAGLNMIEEKEPNLCQACRRIFKDSYEYTRKYREFVKDEKEKLLYGQGAE